MKSTLIIFGLLCGTVIQAYPSWEPDSDEDERDHHSSHSDSSLSHLVPPKNKEECAKNLEWFKNGTEATQELYDKYNLALKQLNFTKNDMDRVSPHHDQVEHYLAESLEKYNEERNKTLSISDSTALLISCGKQMDWQKLLQHNLTGVAKNMKSDILNIADRLGVPQDMKDDLDKTLGRVVNFLFVIDMTKNTFKDIGSLVREAYDKTDEYLAERRAKRAKAKAEAEVEKGEEVTQKENTADYDGILSAENNNLDNDISRAVDDLGKDGEIKDAERRAKERIREQQREIQQEDTNKIEEGIEAEHYIEGRTG